MANESGSQKLLKRSHSGAELDSDEAEVKTKYRKGLNEEETVKLRDTGQIPPLKKTATESIIPTSPFADSGYEISVGNTPGSNKPWKFAQPGSSGYISGSDCSTPAVGQRTPGPLSPDFVSKGKKTIAPFSPGHLRHFIQKKFVSLKDEVIPEGIADTLFADDIISDRDVEAIQEEKFRVEKCDILLKAIVRSAQKHDIHTPGKVISAFEKEGYGHLFKEFEKEKVSSTPSKEKINLTKEEIKGRLYINSSVLEDEIDPISIIDDLVAEQVLTIDEHEDIKTTNFKPRKVKNLIKYLLRKQGKEFWAFCNVLEKHNQNLAGLLKQRISSPIDIGHCKKDVIDVTFIKKPSETLSQRDSDDSEDDERTEVKLYLSGDSEEEERMIVDDNTPDIDLNLQEEAMEIGFQIFNIHLSCIRINLTSMSRQAQMDLLKNCRESPQFLEKWIQKLITEKHIQRLKEKKIDKITFQIKLSLPGVEQRRCSCKLTKEIIVQYYSLLEKELESVDCILETFGKFDGFTENTKDMFKNLLSTRTTENRTENFLRKLLDLPDTRLHLCLLEREMRKSNSQLLQKITNVSSADKEIKLSVGNIRRNMTFLVEELEPRHFRDMLTGLDGSECIMEKIMSTDSRKERCKELLGFIIRKGCTEMFVQELQRNNMDHVLEYLVASKTDEEQTDLKEALVNNYAHIVDEVEPRVFRQMFVERREIKAKVFDAICRLGTRRQRAVIFLQSVLKGKTSVWKCFRDALELAGYRHLVKLINSDIVSYKECPRLDQSLLHGRNEICIEGEMQLRFEQSDIKESALQIFLHRMIYTSDKKREENKAQIKEPEESENGTELISKEIKAKRLLTSNWIQTQQLCRKRERNDLGDSDAPTEVKQFCPGVALAVAGLSPASSPTFGIFRQDDAADNCSSGRFTRSMSRGSDDKPIYEDISPPTSPGRDNIDKPHFVISAPYSPLQVFSSSKRRTSLSDSSLQSSVMQSSPCSSNETFGDNVSKEGTALRAGRIGWSCLRAAFNGHIETSLPTFLRKKHKSVEF